MRRTTPVGVVLAVVATVGLALVSCGSDAGDAAAPTPTAGQVPTSTPPPDCTADPPVELVPEVVTELSHDPAAFTQGLVFLDGRLFESTGLRGSSSLRELDPGTGEVLRQAPVPGDAFAEGVAVDDAGRLVQLTWTEGVAFVRDPETLEVVAEHRYEGEGWGLANIGGGRFAQSDGTDTLTLRDVQTFEPVARVRITRAGGGADQLNELEWDGQHLWANRWRTDEIVRIDLRCARVDAVLDTSVLADRVREVPPEAGAPAPDVVNGVAVIPGTDRYLVSGKRWPLTFDVRLAPA